MRVKRQFERMVSDASGPGRHGPASADRRKNANDGVRSPLLGGLRLTVLGAILVDGSGSPLLRLVEADAAILVGILDVLVLAFALGARSGGHGRDLVSGFGRRASHLSH